MTYASKMGDLVDQLVNDGEFEGDIAGAAEHVVRMVLDHVATVTQDRTIADLADQELP